MLGCGGTGQTGVILNDGRPAGMNGRLTYRDRTGNDQKRTHVDDLEGLSFFTLQEQPENSHRRSVLGRYLLLVQPEPGLQVSMTPGWEAADSRPYLFDYFARHGRLPNTHIQPAKQPAGAVAVTCELAPGETRRADFYLVWWTPDHVVEPEVVARAASGQHAGERVGHYYENHFATPEEVARRLSGERDRLAEESQALQALYAESSLPDWLKRALINSADAVIVNTLLPQDGRLYTLEGVRLELVLRGAVRHERPAPGCPPLHGRLLHRPGPQ